MSDLDVSSAPPSPPAPAGSGAAFPPPAPGPVPEADDRVGKMLALIALVSLGIALITTVLWLGARGDDEPTTDESPAEVATESPADDAQVQLDAANARVAELEAEVAALAASTTTDDELTGQLRQAESDLATARAELAEVTAALETATAADSTDELEASLAAANERIAELESAADQAPSADDLDTPDFDRWVGELLSSRTGGSRLGADASRCFGAAVIDQIGLDALGAGQNNAASGESRQVVIDAMSAAAATCGIDPSLIFG